MEQAGIRKVQMRRLQGRVHAWFSKPANVILLIFLAALTVLTLYPLLSLLTETFTVHTGREARAAGVSAGSLSLYHFRRLFLTREDRKSVV